MQWVPVARLNAAAKLVARRMEERLLGKREAPEGEEGERVGRRVSPRLAGETAEKGRENPEVRRVRQGRRVSLRRREGATAAGGGRVEGHAAKRGRKPGRQVARKRRAVSMVATRGAAKRRREADDGVGEERARAVRACRGREPARVLRPRG